MKISRIHSVGVKGILSVVALILIVLVLVLLLVKHKSSSLDTLTENRQRQTKSYQEAWQKKGIFNVADHARLIKISTYIEQKQEMSDDDLDFWIALLQRGPLKDTPSNRALFYTVVMEDALGRKHLSKLGQKKMYDATLPFVFNTAYVNTMDSTNAETQSSDPASPVNLRTGTEGIAVTLLAQTRDPRALVTLRNIALNSKDQKLRETADEYYKKLLAVQ